MRISLLFIFLGVFFLAACNTASTIPSPVPLTIPLNSTVLTNLTVIDVEKGTAIPGQMVVVSDGIIFKITDQAGQSIPEDVQIIDGAGLFLMPGLVDAHVHYLEAPLFGRLLIANGVLLVRDMGMPNDYILKIRDELNRGEVFGPEMIATGAILDGSPPLIPEIAIGLKTPEEGRAAVRSQVAAGVDMIKVYNFLKKDVFLAIMDEAKNLGVQVAGDLPEEVYLEDAMAAGMSSSEHCHGYEKVIANLLGETLDLNFAGIGAQTDFLLRLDDVDPQALQDFYQRLRASGMIVDPTVITLKNWPNVDTFEAHKLPGSEYISQTLWSIWKSGWIGQTEIPDEIWQNWAKMVYQMNQAGVPLMVGTDLMTPGIIPGFSVHEEMLIWQEAGIPAGDVLRSATLVPAQFMGLGDRLGSLTEGKAANMVLVRANPLEDIRNTQQIEGVFLRGKYYNRQALDLLFAEARNLADQPAP